MSRNGSCKGSSAGIAIALALALQHLPNVTGTFDYVLMGGDNPPKGGTRGGAAPVDQYPRGTERSP